MRIIPLKRNDITGSCYSYLILGDWNRADDVNTVIDPGDDNFIINEIERLSTGFGKIPVEQVILTHNHVKHVGGVKAIKERYNVRVLAFCEGSGVDERLCDGSFIKAGDDILEVLHTPGHSSDSICLYSPSQKTLISGDTQVRERIPADVYHPEYVEALFKIACRDIQKIYSGHEEPITSDCQEIILHTLRNIHRKKDIPIRLRGRKP